MGLLSTEFAEYVLAVRELTHGTSCYFLPSDATQILHAEESCLAMPFSDATKGATAATRLERIAGHDLSGLRNLWI